MEDLTVNELEEIVVAVDSLFVHGDEERLGEVHRRVGFGKLEAGVAG